VRHTVYGVLRTAAPSTERSLESRRTCDSVYPLLYSAFFCISGSQASISPTPCLETDANAVKPRSCPSTYRNTEGWGIHTDSRPRLSYLVLLSIGSTFVQFVTKYQTLKISLQRCLYVLRHITIEQEYIE
jgi:hypothetical protein